jgi:hypothetical protein
MKKLMAMVAAMGIAVMVLGFTLSMRRAEAAAGPQTRPGKAVVSYPERRYDRFDIEVLVNGVPVEQYAARGRRYIEAINGAEYELRIHNSQPMRVAVALSVDGLNTINARHTSAWLASKWVIGPYQTINIKGWQVSSERARHFYFTTERDSYGAKLGQTANLGVISAVFFRELNPVSITVTPPPRRERPPYEGDKDDRGGASKESSAAAPKTKSAEAARSYPIPDDESAATGIGRSVSHDVRWVQLDLDPHPAGEITLRYEFYDGLVRLGIMPRHYWRPDVTRRREDSRGFSPEP